jgi:hypothetical protein
MWGAALCLFSNAFATSAPVMRSSDRPKTLCWSREMGVVAKMAAYAAATYSLVLERRALVKSPP